MDPMMRAWIVEWISEAKTEETRERRFALAMEWMTRQVAPLEIPELLMIRIARERKLTGAGISGTMPGDL